MNVNDIYLIANLPECPKIAQAFADQKSHWVEFKVWLDMVFDAWGVSPERFQTISGNGFVDEVPIKGLIPYFDTYAEAKAAAEKIGEGARNEFDRHNAKHYVRIPLRSSKQKRAAALAAEMGFKGNDDTRAIYWFLSKAIERKGNGLASLWSTPGIHVHGDRVLFTCSQRMSCWSDALEAAGAKRVTLVEAAKFEMEAAEGEVQHAS